MFSFFPITGLLYNDRQIIEKKKKKQQQKVFSLQSAGDSLQLTVA